MSPPHATAIVLLLLLLLSLTSLAAAPGSPSPPFVAGRYIAARHYPNRESCPPRYPGCLTPCDPADVHIAMTLDLHYLRGTVAAVHSILALAACPSLIFFHFVSISSTSSLRPTIHSIFPSLRFKIYSFPASRVAPLITPSARPALDHPLNYARIYLADLLDPCVPRVLYLDSDLVFFNDVRRLWNATLLSAPAVVAAVEHCDDAAAAASNLARYFTDAFWLEEGEWGPRTFRGRRRQPCYFNTGVMVVDLARWRAGGYTRRVEGWMHRQKERRIYELGSLPPLLLVFAGDVEPVEQEWNRHGLGGDDAVQAVNGKMKGNISVLHWSGKEKPWDRLDGGWPHFVDRIWRFFDLYRAPLPPFRRSLRWRWAMFLSSLRRLFTPAPVEMYS